jgi:TolB-like protein
VADGITEGLIDQLGQVQGLRVLSRNAVEQLRGSPLERDSIARLLSAGTIVVGSVDRGSGGNLRVSTRLVDGNSGVDLERESFQVSDDPLAARDSAVSTVASLLRRRIGQEVRILELQAGTRSTEAWTLVQRGSRLRKEAGNEDDPDAKIALLERADSLLLLAAAADPQWPQPRIERGWVALDRARVEQGRARVPFYNRAIALADTVLARQPSNAKALELRGTTRSESYQAKVTDDQRAWERLKTEARDDLEAAIAADPSSATAHLALGQLLYLFEDVPGALLEAQRAYAADAYLENANDVINGIFFGLIDDKQFGTAETWCARGTARFPTDPRFVNCHLFLLVTPGFRPDVPRAWQLRARLDSIGGRPYYQAQAGVLIGGVLARAGLVDSAGAVWQRTRDSILPDVPQAEVGQVQALEAYTRTLAGDMDEAIDLLKRAVSANPDHDFAGTAGQYWWWDELRKSPRWKEIAGGR